VTVRPSVTDALALALVPPWLACASGFATVAGVGLFWNAVLKIGSVEMSLTNEAVYPGEDGAGWYHEFRMGNTHSVIGYPKAKSPCDFNCHVLCTVGDCDCECHG
jgi:hypothetical protein